MKLATSDVLIPATAHQHQRSLACPAARPRLAGCKRGRACVTHTASAPAREPEPFFKPPTPPASQEPGSSPTNVTRKCVQASLSGVLYVQQPQAVTHQVK